MKISIATLIFFVFFNPANSQVGCWRQVSSKSSINTAIKNDGTLWSWGNNQWGQLGIGNTISSNVPVQTGTANDWAQVFNGATSVMALKSDGTLWAWGFNQYGKLGLGSTDVIIASPTQVGSDTDWKQASPSDSSTLAIKNDGSLWCFGNGGMINGIVYSSNVPIQIDFQNQWKEVIEGYFCWYAIRADGTLWAWGENTNGTLGIGTMIPSSVNELTQIGTSTWQHISAAFGHAMGIQTDGSLWSWGSNTTGQIGDGTNLLRMSPVQIGIGYTWTDADAGGGSGVAVRGDGTIWTWGSNVGNFGNGTTLSSNLPIQVQVFTDGYQCSDAGGYSSFLMTDGALWLSGLNYDGNLGFGNMTNVSSATLLDCPGNLGLKELENEMSIEVYPDPADIFINITPHGLLIERLAIYDLLGNKMIEQNNGDKIDVSSLEKGMYIVRVFSANKTQSSKFIKS